MKRTAMKRGKPMRRGKPLARGAGLRRRTPLAKVNRKRHRKRHALQFAEQAALCRRSRCCACVELGEAQRSESVPHHDPTRARGGVDADTVPLCRVHHRAVHSIGFARFWRKVGTPVVVFVERMRAMVSATKEAA